MFNLFRKAPIGSIDVNELDKILGSLASLLSTPWQPSTGTFITKQK